MIGNTCRTPGCTRPAAADRATCHSCRPRTRQSKARTADLHVVDSVVHNRRGVPGLSPADQRLISRKLTALGLPAAEIARIVGRTPRTICRWRAADRAALDRIVQIVTNTITEAADQSQYALASDRDSTTN
jgi:hypothetical protein